MAEPTAAIRSPLLPVLIIPAHLTAAGTRLLTLPRVAITWLGALDSIALHPSLKFLRLPLLALAKFSIEEVKRFRGQQCPQLATTQNVLEKLPVRI